MSETALEIPGGPDELERRRARWLARGSPPVVNLELLAQSDIVEQFAAEHVQRCAAFAASVPQPFRAPVPLPEAASRWILDFCAGTEALDQGGGRGLALIGQPGCGKTAVAWEVLKILTWLNACGDRAVILEVVADVLKECADRSSRRESDVEVIKRLVGAEVTVLDDLGAKRLTEFREEKLLEILDGRYRAGRSTIITTNVSTKRWTEHFGGRNASRIGGMCRPVVFPKVDHRRLRGYRGEGKQEALLDERGGSA